MTISYRSSVTNSIFQIQGVFRASKRRPFPNRHTGGSSAISYQMPGFDHWIKDGKWNSSRIHRGALEDHDQGIPQINLWSECWNWKGSNGWIYSWHWKDQDSDCVNPSEGYQFMIWMCYVLPSISMLNHVESNILRMYLHTYPYGRHRKVLEQWDFWQQETFPRKRKNERTPTITGVCKNWQEKKHAKTQACMRGMLPVHVGFFGQKGNINMRDKKMN